MSYVDLWIRWLALLLAADRPLPKTGEPIEVDQIELLMRQ